MPAPPPGGDPNSGVAESLARPGLSQAHLPEAACYRKAAMEDSDSGDEGPTSFFASQIEKTKAETRARKVNAVYFTWSVVKSKAQDIGKALATYRELYVVQKGQLVPRRDRGHHRHGRIACPVPRGPDHRARGEANFTEAGAWSVSGAPPHGISCRLCVQPVRKDPCRGSNVSCSSL